MTEATFTPHLVLWTAPGGPMRAASDETGQLLVFTDDALAAMFSARLAAHGFTSAAMPTDAGAVVDLLLAAGVSAEDAPHRVSVFEAQTLSDEDAEQWAVELADRLVKNIARPTPDDLS